MMVKLLIEYFISYNFFESKKIESNLCYEIRSPWFPLPDNIFSGRLAFIYPHFSGVSKHDSKPRCNGALHVAELKRNIDEIVKLRLAYIVVQVSIKLKQIPRVRQQE
jgi:hypothetical protein